MEVRLGWSERDSSTCSMLKITTRYASFSSRPGNNPRPITVERVIGNISKGVGP